MEGERVTMAVQNSATFYCSWTELSVLGSQVFEQALMESCELGCKMQWKKSWIDIFTEYPGTYVVSWFPCTIQIRINVHLYYLGIYAVVMFACTIQVHT